METGNIQEDLSHIRSMMERSSRFLSLSGLSGVFAGFTALAGAVYIYFVLKRYNIDYFDGKRNVFTEDLVGELLITGIAILAVAVLLGYSFTAKKSRARNLKIWDATSRRLLLSFAVPLVSGAIFCFGLLYHGLFVFVAPATLVFYGLGLVNASKHTYGDVKYLGLLEIALGLTSLFYLGWGLVFWAIGFGVLHIIYGLVMHQKYN